MAEGVTRKFPQGIRRATFPPASAISRYWSMVRAAWIMELRSASYFMLKISFHGKCLSRHFLLFQKTQVVPDSRRARGIVLIPQLDQYGVLEF